MVAQIQVVIRKIPRREALTAFTAASPFDPLARRGGWRRLARHQAPRRKAESRDRIGGARTRGKGIFDPPKERPPLGRLNAFAPSRRVRRAPDCGYCQDRGCCCPRPCA
jgi:hypothetical protein